jgi:hypothetical protein
MNWNAHGTWLEGEEPETEPTQDEAHSATLRLPEGTPSWTSSTIYLQRIHDALVAKGWGTGPV